MKMRNQNSFFPHIAVQSQLITPCASIPSFPWLLTICLFPTASRIPVTGRENKPQSNDLQIILISYRSPSFDRIWCLMSSWKHYFCFKASLSSISYYSRAASLGTQMQKKKKGAKKNLKLILIIFNWRNTLSNLNIQAGWKTTKEKLKHLWNIPQPPLYYDGLI